jgi:hypothetical protein
VRRTIAGFFHPLPHPYYDFLLREQGYGEVAELAKRHVPAGQTEPVIAAMSDEMIDRLALTGTAGQCAERLRAYRGLIDEAVLLNVGPDVRGVLQIASEGIHNPASTEC